MLLTKRKIEKYEKGAKRVRRQEKNVSVTAVDEVKSMLYGPGNDDYVSKNLQKMYIFPTYFQLSQL